ncbi:oxalate:formate antiporter [Oxobacter pfennigii]|uniref:Oxalate:formate antiporter n=1 Tax=Oxobacter pfennigii TaxID=36849 RepID=A0A0P8Z233_9CLOT|nr:MFS transporter [Oxobacter pfennigii]KPU46199.1 oxalate:formate antiporter [Oxobacter pfennigii]
MSFLLKGVGENKRWFYPISAFFMAAFMAGGLWSMFYPHVQTHFKLENVATIVLISTFTGLGTMVVGPPVAGYILDKYGPKIPLALAAVFYFTGYAIVSTVLKQPSWSNALPLWYIGGFFCGFGGGLFGGTYTSTVAKWFPDRVGTAMGIAVAGGGTGTIFMSPLTASFIASSGFSGTVFIILGLLGLFWFALGCIFWKMPDNDWKPAGWIPKSPTTGKVVEEQKQFTLPEAVRDKRFWILYGGFLCSAFANTLFGQNASMIIIEGLTKAGMERADILAMVVPTYLSINAFGGLIGRFTWGWLMDKMGGPFRTLPIVYFISGVMIWVFYMGYTSSSFIFAVAAILSFTLAGEPVLHYAAVPSIFGRRHIGKIMNTINSFSVGIGITVGGVAGASIRDALGGYFWALVVAVVLRMIAASFATTGFFVTRKMDAAAKKTA